MGQELKVLRDKDHLQQSQEDNPAEDHHQEEEEEERVKERVKAKAKERKDVNQAAQISPITSEPESTCKTFCTIESFRTNPPCNVVLIHVPITKQLFDVILMR